MSHRSGKIEHMFDEGKVMWERLPEGVAEMAPGPELGRVLATVDRTRLNGHDLVVLMQAHNRQLAHYQAELYADMAELTHTPPVDPDTPPERSEGLYEHAADEIQVALTWTRARAGNELGLAVDLYETLPEVWQSLQAGKIDGPKARTLACGTEHLTPNTAREVTGQLLDEAAELTTGRLWARLRRLCIKTDPDEAADLYQQGLQDGKIVISANPDGTANLSGYQLPPHRANVITARINNLARQLKTKDETRSLDLLTGSRHRHPQHKEHTPKAVVDIHVNLETLTGMAEDPGEIPGWGPVVADLARQITEQQHDAEWRYQATDNEGELVAAGTIRRRPTAGQRRTVEAKHPVCVFPGCRMPARHCESRPPVVMG